MHPSKSPSPNGMSPFFFQNFWHVVEVDVSNVVLSFLNSGHFLRKMSYTHCFHPKKEKKKEPLYMFDFHLISLENIISRIFQRLQRIG